MEDTRNIVITGAAGGMGSAALAQLIDRNINVVAVDLSQEAVQSVIDDLGPTRGEFVAVGADVSDEKAVEQFIQLPVKRWGGLDGLFNIAGHQGEVKPMIEATVENFDHVVAVNARSVFLGMKFAVPHLRNRGGGTVVSTGSYLAVRGSYACGPYGASKHAVVGLSSTLAVEEAVNNIRSNVVCPGPMETRMIESLFPELSNDPDEARSMVTASIPDGRMALPAELAQSGLWLLLDAPSHVTGQVLMVDGGQSAT